MSGIMALGFAVAVLNLWALVDAFHLRRDRVLWLPLTLAGFACGVSTAPFLVPPAVYILLAYIAMGRPVRREGARTA